MAFPFQRFFPHAFCATNWNGFCRVDNARIEAGTEPPVNNVPPVCNRRSHDTATRLAATHHQGSLGGRKPGVISRTSM
jgi:hypothetical protein